MRIRVFAIVLLIAILALLTGCQCGCLKGSSLPESDPETAYRETAGVSYPVISTELEVRTSYGQSF